jgi:hypothetical protein
MEKRRAMPVPHRKVKNDPSGWSRFQRSFKVIIPLSKGDLFIWTQIGIAGFFIAIAWFFFGPRERESQFGLREADRRKPPPLPGQKAHPTHLPLSGPNAGKPDTSKPRGPFLLEGFVGDGNAHDILGIPRDADEKTIRAAHRELMKRYHPDLVGRPGSREWKDAQKIAETLNRARDELLPKPSKPS